MKRLLVACFILSIGTSAIACDSKELIVDSVNETIEKMIEFGDIQKDEVGKITIAELFNADSSNDSFSYSIQRKDSSIFELGHAVVDLAKCEFTTLPNGAISHTGSSYFVFESK